MKSKIILLAIVATTAVVWGRDPVSTVPMDLKAPLLGKRIPGGPPHPAVGLPIPGGPGIEPGPVVTENLSCEPPMNKDGKMLVGSKYTMTCESQNKAPGKRKVSCKLFRSPVVPNAKKTEIPLVVDKKKKETEKTAYFASEDGDSRDIKIKVTKHPISAQVKFESTGTHFSCVSVHKQ